MCKSQGANANLTSSDASKGCMQMADDKMLTITIFFFFNSFSLFVWLSFCFCFLVLGFYPCIKQAKNSEYFRIFTELQPKNPESENLVAKSNQIYVI